MLTKNVRELAEDLVYDLMTKGLLSHLDRCGDNNFEDWFYTNNLEDDGYWYGIGMTKICIGHICLDNWVIKFSANDSSKDYMAREYEIYQEAERQNMTEFFPQTFFLGRFEGRDCYIQERAECNERDIYSECYNQICSFYEEESKEYNSDLICDEVDTLNDDERVNLLFHNSELIDFLYEHEINDLHEGNFGLINGKFVIIDFSGY